MTTATPPDPACFAASNAHPMCPRCGCYLNSHNRDAHGLCDPCRRLVDSCVPFAGIALDRFEILTAPAPENVDLLRLVAGLLLLHDALHPGEALHLRRMLAAYGVDLDNVETQGLVKKLRRRGLDVVAQARVAGYALAAE